MEKNVVFWERGLFKTQLIAWIKTVLADSLLLMNWSVILKTSPNAKVRMSKVECFISDGRSRWNKANTE